MAKYRLDYIWLDGYTPVQNLRTKCMLRDFDEFPTLDQLPEWGFDGSSTQQAEGGDSDCVLKPVALYPDGTREDGILVMCEVMLPTAALTHPTVVLPFPDDEGTWFGFEQEYFLMQEGVPLGFPKGGYPNHRVNTTVVSVLPTSAESLAKSPIPTSISASTLASTTKALTPRWPKVSGNSRCLPKAPRKLLTISG